MSSTNREERLKVQHSACAAVPYSEAQAKDAEGKPCEGTCGREAVSLMATASTTLRGACGTRAAVLPHGCRC